MESQHLLYMNHGSSSLITPKVVDRLVDAGIQVVIAG